jgi:mannose-6-phosphate isomerase-like protein (cupin superfamily)
MFVLYFVQYFANSKRIKIITMIFSETTNKESVFLEVKNFLAEKQLSIASQDDARPWGGFFVIDENDAEKFITAFFPHLTIATLTIAGKLSPKILVVAPQTRLSWQYHHRRAEIWKLISGEAAVIVSETDKENDATNLKKGDIVELKKGERHRLIGTNGWGIVAEIWRHTDANNPSDEDDIIRVQDDFGR